jgi:hypothetical protein
MQTASLVRFSATPIESAARLCWRNGQVNNPTIPATALGGIIKVATRRVPLESLPSAVEMSPMTSRTVSTRPATVELLRKRT